MASAVIHIAVANEVNKVLNFNSNKLLIGTIAPDISKLIGESKHYSHFLCSKNSNIPNIDKFLSKYKNSLNDDFVMGYFIHLYTDYLWFKYFVPELYSKSVITKLDGTEVKCSGNMVSVYFYNDYTNMNTKLLDEYNLDLKIFYNDIPSIKNIIKEIPMDKLDLIVNQMGNIIVKSREKKDLIFDISDVKKFIETSTKLIISKINELNL